MIYGIKVRFFSPFHEVAFFIQSVVDANGCNNFHLQFHLAPAPQIYFAPGAPPTPAPELLLLQCLQPDTRPMRAGPHNLSPR